MYTTGESFKSMGAWVPTMYTTGESFKSMGAWVPTMYTTGESFKSMGAWAPTTFSKVGCEKSFFENHGCQGTHDVRTLSFLTMYGEGQVSKPSTLLRVSEHLKRNHATCLITLSTWHAINLTN